MQSAVDLTRLLRSVAVESELLHANRQAMLVARSTTLSLQHATATRQLSHSYNLLASGIAKLRQLVTAFDKDIAGTEIGSLAELGLRAQTLIILLLGDELYEAIRREPAAYQELFVGRFRTIEDVVSFLCDSLARINRLWLRYRARLGADGVFTLHLVGAQEWAWYRSGIRRAQSAFAALRADPDFAHFLRVGSSRGGSSRIGNACDLLGDVLLVTVSREPEPSLLLAAALLEPEELLDFAVL